MRGPCSSIATARRPASRRVRSAENETHSVPTTSAFATALAHVAGITVVTNSIDVAARLWAGPAQPQVYLLGGTYSGEVYETVGPDTVQQVHKFHADHAVLTIGAVDARGGFMDYDMSEAMIAAAMVEQSRAVTVLADHSKLSRTALVKVCVASSTPTSLNPMFLRPIFRIESIISRQFLTV